MTQPSASSAEGSLQFEHAERDRSASTLTCALCSQPVATSYYEVNGNVSCQRCRNQVLARWNRGSSGRRFAKALGLGFAAAALGAGIYFGVAALTGYEFGLVAIVVGVLVGGAVRKGSNGRGGWRYQLIAMFLTYTAVVVTDSSLIARELKKEWRVQADSAQAVSSASSAAQPAVLNASTDRATGASHLPRPLAVALGLALIVALAYAAPIMIGIVSPLHLLIAGFALYEAWKLNRGVALQVTGPYQAAARPAAA